MTTHQPTKTVRIIFGICILALSVSGYFFYREHGKATSLQNALTSTQSSKDALEHDKDARIAELEATVASTTELLHVTEEARDALSSSLDAKQNDFNQLSAQVKNISGTVGVLDKLSKTDSELLMKYSKVYFLSENYIPAKLTQIEQQYSAVKADQYLEGHVYTKVTRMIDDAKDDGVNIEVRSAYRSFESQKNLKGAYNVSYGKGANTFSADQGYSEHQLGTAADFTSKENAEQLVGFDTTKAFAWMSKNAYKYGFILSYPKNNGYYIFEPWHWRFVGVKLATDLHDDGKYFYNLDQREINKYLVSLFD